MQKAICLVGFMGSGKTTIGGALGKLTHYHWIDLDHFIEKEEKDSIANIFAKNGEAYFRDLENRYLKKVLSQKPVIISTGGGIILKEENRHLLKEQSTFYLSYEFDTLYHRIAGDRKRPLVTSYDEVKERFNMRRSLYEEASRIKIECEGKKVQQIVEEIQSYLSIT